MIIPCNTLVPNPKNKKRKMKNEKTKKLINNKKLKNNKKYTLT